MNVNHHILVTRELTGEQIELARSLGLKVSVEPAIEITFRDNWLSVQSVIQQADKPVFVFTSQNGAKAFLRFKSAGIEIPKNANIYAVGNKTAEVLREEGFSVKVPEVQYGTELAKQILSETERKEKQKLTILHFCGDKRRDELRDILTGDGLDVKDIVVYQTKLKPVNPPDEKTDAILFYSPSAVQSFRNSGGFENRSLPELFAIGNTTAEALSIASGKNVHVPPEPSSEVLLKFTARILRDESF